MYSDISVEAKIFILETPPCKCPTLFPITRINVNVLGGFCRECVVDVGSAKAQWAASVAETVNRMIRLVL